MNPRQASELAAELIGLGTPILTVDTCALLDVLRLPHRHNLEPNILRGCRLIVDSDSPGVSIVISSTVMTEIQEHLWQVRTEAERQIREIERTVGRVNDVSKELGLEGFRKISEFDSARLVESLEKEIVSVRTLAKVLQEDANHKLKAGDRVMAGRAPSRKGAQQFKDCVIIEAYLDLARELRNGSFAGPIIFVSSNTNDFGGEGSALKSDLVPDFAAVNIQFATNLASAAHKLGLL